VASSTEFTLLDSVTLYSYASRGPGGEVGLVSPDWRGPDGKVGLVSPDRWLEPQPSHLSKTGPKSSVFPVCFNSLVFMAMPQRARVVKLVCLAQIGGDRMVKLVVHWLG
jgi:hypothetical protein